MTIENLDEFIENLWDWSFLERYLGGFGIRPTDLDGLVERNGNLLLLEAKSPTAKIPRGQRILFDRLVWAKCPHCEREIKKFDVLVIWGEPNQPEKMRMWRIHDQPIDATEADVQKLVGTWYQEACHNGN